MSCARQVHDHIRSTPYLARRPPYLAPLVLYLNPTLQGCYQVLIRGQMRHVKGLIHPVITCETAVNIGILNRSQRRIGRSDRPLWCDGVGVRVSAHLRHGAAPYANGCEHILGHSHLISLSILSA